MIAAARVVAGQVVAPSDQLFQIIDPASLMVEALVFDQIDPTAVEEATATLSTGASIKLKFIGRSRALQNQYSVLQFQIVESGAPLDAGAPVTVTAPTNQAVTGIVMPRSALAQAPSGQTVVFSHTEPEVFLPRPVRFDDLDADNVVSRQASQSASGSSCAMPPCSTRCGKGRGRPCSIFSSPPV